VSPNVRMIIQTQLFCTLAMVINEGRDTHHDISELNWY